MNDVLRKMAAFAETGPVLKRLIDFGYRVHLRECEDHTTSVSGYVVNPRALIIVLRHDARFYEDCWNFLHPEIEDPVGFREFKTPERKGSAQIVIGQVDGRFHMDVDGHNTQDVVNIAAHLGWEVILKKLFGRKEPHGSADRVL